MKFSSYTWRTGVWAGRPRRGWIIGPFLGRTLTVTVEREPNGGNR